MNLLDIRRPATLADVGVLRARLSAALDGIRLSSTAANDLVTAAGELLNNAVKHSSPPATEIGLRLDLNHQALTLEVLDDGGPFAGFSFLEPVPLNPLDDALVEGGMGLFIVRRVFPVHDYRPGANGEPNRFRVCHTLKARRRRLLLLEDNTTIRHLVEIYLAPDYELIPCDTVAEARLAVERASPDLILSDINLPDASAFDLVRELSQRPYAAPIPVVLMTGDGGAAVRDMAVALGVDDFITKPIQRRSLVETLRRALNRSDRESAQMLRHLAGTLSSALAPALPAPIPGWSCAVRALTAGHGGGDMVFALPGAKNPLVVVADVMGHGASAKILAHAYAGCFHGLALGTNIEGEPGELLSAFSEAVSSAALFESSMITVMALGLDQGGLVRLASAGHPPPLLLHRGDISALAVDGPLAGLLRKPLYPALSLRLEWGDRLLIGTDGLLSDGKAGITCADFHPVLLATLAATAERPLAEAADRLLEAVRQSFGAEPADDATFVLLEPTTP